MQKLIFILSLLCCAQSQAQWQETFDNVNALTNYPNADWSDWIINSQGQLQTHAGSPGFEQAVFDLPTLDSVWEVSLFVRQNFAGSANNFGRIMLTELGIPDSGGFNQSTGASGLLIQLGNAGSNDQIDVFWDTGTNSPTPLGSGFNIANGVYGELTIRWDSLLHVAFQDNDSSQATEVFHSASMPFFVPQKLTLQAQFTISNASNFYWDNLYAGSPWVPWVPNPYDYRSVVINEIMADPSPSHGCPEVEYLEIFNPSSTDSVHLKDWILFNTTTENLLPDIWMPPQAYQIICDVSDIFQWPQSVIGIPSFSALTNTGDSLTLVDALGNVIDVVHYHNYWHNDSNGLDGGIALEQINPFLHCSNRNNWASSTDPSGGTPGSANSIYDALPPNEARILDWGIDSDGIIYLWPSLPIQMDSVQVAMGNQTQFWPMRCFSDSALIFPPNHQPSENLVIENLSFCDEFLETDMNLDYSIPRNSFDSLWVQEILFHPKPDEYAFIELYNPNAFAISIDPLLLSNGNDLSKKIQYHHHFMLPHSCLAITESIESIQRSFPQSVQEDQHLHFCENMPYWTQSEGQVILLLGSDTLDKVHYSEAQHHPIFTDYVGKSLEKVIPEISDSPWMTASEMMGYGTPGITNSQHWWNQNTTNQWGIYPPCFSPNGDGKDDFVQIQMDNQKPGNVVHWYIVDSRGIPIYSSPTHWVANEGKWIWDGRNNEGWLCSPGLYGWVMVTQDEKSNLFPSMKTFVLSP
jgi:hypothetical protein